MEINNYRRESQILMTMSYALICGSCMSSVQALDCIECHSVSRRHWVDGNYIHPNDTLVSLKLGSHSSMRKVDFLSGHWWDPKGEAFYVLNSGGAPGSEQMNPDWVVPRWVECFSFLYFLKEFVNDRHYFFPKYLIELTSEGIGADIFFVRNKFKFLLQFLTC